MANLPISGLFDVMGMMDDTVFRKMVSDSKIVTPEIYIFDQIAINILLMA